MFFSKLSTPGSEGVDSLKVVEDKIVSVGKEGRADVDDSELEKAPLQHCIMATCREFSDEVRHNAICETLITFWPFVICTLQCGRCRGMQYLRRVLAGRIKQKRTGAASSSIFSVVLTNEGVFPKGDSDRTECQAQGSLRDYGYNVFYKAWQACNSTPSWAGHLEDKNTIMDYLKKFGLELKDMDVAS